jgi:hypothetical protein
VKTKPFVIGFLAVVAVIAAVSFYIGATIDRADKTVSALVAPDGKFKVVRVSIAGGGATPFCVVSISVLLAVYPDDFAEREKSYEVFAAPCGKFADGAPSPKIEWLSGTALQIVYAASSAGPATKMPRQKNIDVTRSVHVTFVAHE